MGAIGRMGLIVMGRYPLTGCGCWYWPRSGVHRRFWVGDGRPTAAGVAFHYDWLPSGDVASDLTTDCSGASRRHWRHGSVVCPSERKGVVRPRTLVRAEGVRWCMATLVSDRSGEWQQLWLVRLTGQTRCGAPRRCLQDWEWQCVGALTERRPQ